jgi:endonuclease/exonuclease/phosphatase (EEP) superfamily protein YafD
MLSRALAGNGSLLEWLLDLAAHWQWLFLALLFFATAIMVLTDRRWVLLVLAAPVPWITASPPGPSTASRDPPATLTIASANVFKGNQDAAPLMALLDREKPDIVVVLEVTRGYADGLQAAKDYPYRHVLAQADAFGIAILSRHAIHSAQEARNEEGLPIVQVTIGWNGRSVALSAFHPMPPQSTYYHAARNTRLESLTPAPDDADVPMIVAGDLNATPWSNAFSGLDERGWRRATGLAPTWPAAWGGWMGIPIDHVLIDRHWTVAGSAVGPDIGSDHLPVLVRLAWNPRPSDSGPARR